MSAWLVWLALAAQAPAAQESPRAGLTAVVRAPAAAQVGEPFELSVELTHQQGLRPLLQTDAVGAGWVVLDEHGSVTRPETDERAITPELSEVTPERSEVTTFRWTVVALEPAEDALPELLASYPDGSLEAPFVEPGGIDVAPALAPDEDAPRPVHGFRSVPADERRSLWGYVPASGLTCAAGIAGALFYLRRRRQPSAPAAPPTPLERLVAIDPRALADSAELQQVYYTVSTAVRAAFDARLGVDPRERAGRTDEEWLALARASGRLAEADGDLLADLLRSCADVKYGGARPTHWAVQETLERARALLSGAASKEAEVAP